MSLAFIVIHGGTEARARWMLWSQDVGSEMLRLSLFFEFVNGMRWILVEGSTMMFPKSSCQNDMCLAGWSGHVH
jgi:hypothetical protein